jgi:hypothetical protein
MFDGEDAAGRASRMERRPTAGNSKPLLKAVWAKCKAGYFKILTTSCIDPRNSQSR